MDKHQLFINFLSEFKSQDPALVEGLIKGYKACLEAETMQEGTIGRALAGAGLALGLAAGHANAGVTDTTSIPVQAKEYTQQIKEKYLDSYDANNEAYQSAVKHYADLKKTDPDQANLFARTMNNNLKPFSIFKPIGDVVAN